MNLSRRGVFAAAMVAVAEMMGQRGGETSPALPVPATAPVLHQYSYEAAIYDACARHGCNGDQLVRVMYCESGGDPGAVGPNGERGIFQFHPYGEWPYAAWYGPYEQIELAAQLFAAGRADAWVCK